MNTRISVIDDQELIRLGVVQALMPLTSYLFMIGCVSVEEFCRSPACAQTDVLILDDTLESTPVLDAVTTLHQRCSRARIVVLGGQLNGMLIQKLLSAGVMGVMTKTEQLSDTLPRAIRSVRTERPFLSPEAALIASQTVQTPRLTPRQHKLLQLVAAGHYAQDIAQMLDISPGAVYAGLARLRNTLGVQNDAQLGAEARRRGLLDDA